MYQNLSTGFINELNGTSRHFHCKLSRTGEELTGFRSVKVTQQANPETDSFTIGGTVAAVAEVRMDKPKTLVTGKEYQLSFGLEVNGAVEWCPVCIVTPEKPKENDGLITFTAYDRMVTKLNYPYYTDIKSYPVDAKTILQEISAKTGVAIANLSSLPAGITIHKRAQENEDGGTATAVTPFSGYTYREAVKYIAQLYGTFATMNRNGQLEFCWYTETGYTVELDRSLTPAVANEKEYQVQRIICAAGKAAIPGFSSGIILNKFHGPVHADDDNIITAGSGATGITFENPVMSLTVMEKLWAKMKGFRFTPTTVSFLGDCRLDLGDIITVKTRADSVKVPVMGLSYEYDGGLTTEIGSYGSSEVQEASAYASPSNRIVDYVNSEMLVVKDLVANKVSTEVLEANYATIKSLDAVEAKIDKITATDITTEYLEANYAEIDLANIDTAVIRQGFLEELMVSQGIIADRVSAGTVTATDVLTGVNIYADDITAGTLSVDRLILRGDNKSLVYALNNSGKLVSTEVDTLDAYILTERTVTADKIVTKSLTATEIDVTDLRVNGFVKANQLKADNISAGAITAEKIDVKSLEAIAAKIGGFTIGARYIANGTTTLAGAVNSVFLGLDGISCGKDFKVTAAGEVAANNLTATGSFKTHAQVYEGYSYSCALSGYGLRISGTAAGLATPSAVLDPHALTVKTEGAGTLSGTAVYSAHEALFKNSSNADVGSIGANSDTLFIYGYKGGGIRLDANSIVCSSWLRTEGNTGWYSQNHGGGWYMTDPTWIRSYGSKNVYINAQTSTEYLGINYNTILRGSGYNMYCNGKSYFTGHLTAAKAKGFYVTLNNGATVPAGVSDTTNNLNIGSNSYVTLLRGSTVYLKSTSTTVTSDLRRKKNIESLKRFEHFFDLLNPFSFTYDIWEENGESYGSTSGRTHFGFGAQEVCQALIDSGFTTKDFAGYVDFSINGGPDELGIAPMEFIPLNTYMIQKTRTEVEELRERVKELENEIESLKASERAVRMGGSF